MESSLQTVPAESTETQSLPTWEAPELKTSSVTQETLASTGAGGDLGQFS